MSGFLKDVWTILLREVLRYRRDRSYILGQLLLPVLAVLFIGFPLSEQVSQGRYASYLASGLIVLIVTSGAIAGGFTLIEDVQRGFLRPILVAPVTRTSIMVGKIFARILISLILVLVLIVILQLFTELSLQHPVIVLGVLAAITLGFLGLGVVLATFIGQLESFRTAALLVTVPMYLLSGMFFPIENMPLAMQVLAVINPLTYGVDLFRYGTIHYHEFPLAANVLVVVAFPVLMTVLAARAFERRLAG